MAALAPGTIAPAVPGLDFGRGPSVLFFYKVTCPVCQMAAPKAHRFATAYPGRIAGVGQDPPEKLSAFDAEFGLGFDTLPDLPPYDLSEAYRIRVVPTLFLIDETGVVADGVESWDREGYNRVSRSLAEHVGAAFAPISERGDGLPPFRPG